jgi:hypothetical protein
MTPWPPTFRAYLASRAAISLTEPRLLTSLELPSHYSSRPPSLRFGLLHHPPLFPSNSTAASVTSSNSSFHANLPRQLNILSYIYLSIPLPCCTTTTLSNCAYNLAACPYTT